MLSAKVKTSFPEIFGTDVCEKNGKWVSSRFIKNSICFRNPYQAKKNTCSLSNKENWQISSKQSVTQFFKTLFNILKITNSQKNLSFKCVISIPSTQYWFQRCFRKLKAIFLSTEINYCFARKLIIRNVNIGYQVRFAFCLSKEKKNCWITKLLINCMIRPDFAQTLPLRH